MSFDINLNVISADDDDSDAPFIWRPPGPVAREFILSKARVKGIKGPFGSGKTMAAMMCIIHTAAHQPMLKDGTKRMRVVIVRNTMDQIRTTVWKTWLELVGEDVGDIHTTSPMSHRLNVQSLTPGCPFIDLEVWFLALDRPSDVRKFKGIDVTMAHLEEATELPEEVLHIATARIPRYPKARDEFLDNPMHRCVMMTTNPPSVAHWWHRLAVKEKPAGWDFFEQPSGLSPQAENVNNLEFNYYSTISAGKPQEWVNIFVHGNYGYLNTNRSVYPTWSDAIHTGKWDRAEMREHRYPLFLGVDFGLTPAVSFAYQLPFGRWLVDREITTTNCGAVQLGQEIIRVLKAEYPWYWENNAYKATCDPAGKGRVQTDMNTPLLVLQALGILAQQAETNDPVARQEPINGLLGRLVDGQAAIQVHEDCKVLLEGFGGGYHYRKLDISGDAQYGTDPVKNTPSHVHDSLQYLFLGAGEGSPIAMTGQKDSPRFSKPLRAAAKASIW